MTRYDHNYDYLDHQNYVGGFWEEIGTWQKRMIQELWTPHEGEKFLDLACGSMRLGRLIVNEVPEYWGHDFNQKYVDIGIKEEIPAENHHKLNITINDNFDFSDMPVMRFIWCNGLFQHVTLDEIETCAKNLKGISDESTEFVFNYCQGDSSNNPKESFYPCIEPFWYSEKEITDVLTSAGWSVKILDIEPHPRTGKGLVFDNFINVSGRL